MELSRTSITEVLVQLELSGAAITEDVVGLSIQIEVLSTAITEDVVGHQLSTTAKTEDLVGLSIQIEFVRTATTEDLIDLSIQLELPSNLVWRRKMAKNEDQPELSKVARHQD